MEIVSYAMGEGAGYDEGYTGGYEEGYKAGEASSTAYQDGYTAGETAGYNSGYSAGYDEGVASVNSVKDLLDQTKNTDNLFYYTSSSQSALTNEKLAALIKYNDTENVVSMGNMFMDQYLLTEIPQLNTGNVTNMSCMFKGYNKPPFNNGGVPPYFNTSKVTNINEMFFANGAYQSPTTRSNNMTSIPLYDFRKVTSCNNFIRGCRGLKSLPAFNFEALPTNSTFFSTAGASGWLNGTGINNIHIIDIHYAFNISGRSSFTREALVEIIGNLRDMTGSTALTLTMGSTNLAKLTEDDIAVATDKNWTVS